MTDYDAKYEELVRAFLPVGRTATDEEVKAVAAKAKELVEEFIRKAYATPQPLRRIGPDDDLAEALGVEDE
jgi:hypothetical protein